jgi:hypothetical protein
MANPCLTSSFVEPMCEINMYDSNSFLINDLTFIHFQNKLFKGHKCGHKYT